MSTDGDQKTGPAYVTYASLKTFLKQMKDLGIPSQINKSVMTSFSGGTQSHLVSALRFLGLMDATGSPTAAMRTLVDAVETEKWGASLKPVVERAYGEILGDVDLKDATPQQVEEKFRAAGLDGSTVTKAMRFFLLALKETETAHSPHLGRRRKSTAPRRTTRRENGQSPPVTPVAPKGAEPKDIAGMISESINFPRRQADGSLRRVVGEIVYPEDITPAECELIIGKVKTIQQYATASAGIEEKTTT